MAKLQIKRDIFNKALDRSALNETDRESVTKLGDTNNPKSSVTAPVREYPLSSAYDCANV